MKKTKNDMRKQHDDSSCESESETKTGTKNAARSDEERTEIEE
jgi:hypothetical protein